MIRYITRKAKGGIMQNLLTMLVMVSSVPFIIFGTYFFVVAIFGLKKDKSAPNYAPRKRFALVVAARNEEAVIGNIVDSLNAQNYPKQLFDVIVAPNNCTDNTELVAKTHGAIIFKHKGSVKSKGEVLTQVVDELVVPNGYDAMCVFDADCLAAPNFLLKTNNELMAGANAVQGFRDSKNPKDSTVSGWYAICYWMLNRFYNAPRKALGLSALISGNGFAITTELLQKLGGWHTVTMTEDYEVSAQIALLGEKVVFAPEAIVYNDLPDTFNVSWKQRRRWVSGSLEGLKIYGGSLFKLAVNSKSAVALDMWFTFLSPIMGLASFIFGVVSSTIFGLIPMLVMMASSIISSVLGAAFAAFITIKLKNSHTTGMWRAIASFCVFLASQMAITVSCLFKMQTKWEPILHTKAVSIDDIKAA